MRKHFFIFILLSTLFACGKETELSKGPVELSFDTLVPVSEMRFFVAGREINPQFNQVTVQSFLDRYYSEKTPTGTISYQSKFTEPEAESYGKFPFTYHASNDIRYGGYIIETKNYEDVILLKSKITNKVKDVPVVESDLFKYKFDLNSNGTYNYQYVVNGDDQALEASLLYYKLVRYDEQGNRKELSFGTMHNEFNEAFAVTMGTRDTLAVKEYRLKFSRKQ